MDFRISFEICKTYVNLIELNIVCLNRTITTKGFINYDEIVQYSMQTPEQIMNKYLKIISRPSYQMYFKITNQKLLIIEKIKKQTHYHNFIHDDKTRTIPEIQHSLKILIENVDYYCCYDGTIENYIFDDQCSSDDDESDEDYPPVWKI